MTGQADLLFAIACASQLSGLPWDGKSVPKYTTLDSDYIPQTGKQTSRDGETVTNSARAQGLYKWIANEIITSRMADKPALVHEATHYLQSRNGMWPSNPDIERQPYDAEKRAPYECMGLFGGWKAGLLADHIKSKD